MQPFRRDMEAKRQCRLNGDQQSLAGNIEGILVGKKLLPGETAELFEASQRRIDFSASRPDEIRIETHVANASLVPCRSNGARSR